MYIPRTKTGSAPISALALSMALLMANRAEQLMQSGGSPTPDEDRKIFIKEVHKIIFHLLLT